MDYSDIVIFGLGFLFGAMGGITFALGEKRKRTNPTVIDGYGQQYEVLSRGDKGIRLWNACCTERLSWAEFYDRFPRHEGER